MEQNISKHSLSTSSSKETKKFLTKILMGLVLLALYINSLLPQYNQSYNAALTDKVKRLESITTPKIVLIGNSNVAWGIDSKMLETEMGMPVVNMGFNANLGNAFHEEMAKLNVTPGDIYVLCHTSYKDNNRIFKAERAWSTIENNYHLWKLLRLCDFQDMADSFPVYLKKSLQHVSLGTGNRIPNSIYARQSFNEYGDVGVLREKSIFKKKVNVEVPSINKIAINRINALNEYLLTHGATLLIAGYPIGNGDLTEAPSKFIIFQKQLESCMKCPIISNYVEYMFDYSYFYDSNILHLNTEGARLRTKQLILDLKEWMQLGTVKRNDKYCDIIHDVKLSHIDDFCEYIGALNNSKSRYTIFVSVNNATSSIVNAETLERIKMLGLSMGWEKDRQYNYAAVIENGKVSAEITQYEKIEISGECDDGNLTYSMKIDGKNKECGSSIQLNGREYSKNISGVNFVVYSNETHRRLDEVGFAFSASELIAHR